MRRALFGVVASWIAVGVAAGCASLSGLSSGGSADAGDAGAGHDATSTTHKDTGAAKADAARDAKAPKDGGDSGSDAAIACVIGGTSYQSGAKDPTNSCEGCMPSVAISAWSNLSDGTACGTGGICYLGGCLSGCEIGGVYYATGTVDQSNHCQSCQPGQSTSTWRPIPDGTDCGNSQVCGGGECGTQCDIAGTVTSSGTTNPANSCESCQPGTSTSVWTSVADGTSCKAGEVCSAASCGAGCFIGGTIYAPLITNPNNACQSCQPGTSTTAWSSVTDGTDCGNDQICGNGECGTQCAIGSVVYSSGALNPSNACQGCQPGTSTSMWTGATDGTSCGAGSVCKASACAVGCFIAGTVYASQAANPTNACQLCEPNTSTTAWTGVADGTTCGTQKVCKAATCVVGCSIAGTAYTSGTKDPANLCLSCQPSASTTGWTDVANGTSCGAGEACTSGMCLNTGSGSGSGSDSGTGSGTQ